MDDEPAVSAAEPPLRFTAHNIVLPGGEQTLPRRGVPLEDQGSCQASLRTLRALFRAEEIPASTIVDLGCLEGGFTVAFARAGFQALGIEVRAQNFDKCEYVAEKLGLPNLRFVQDDVRNIEKHGPFDAVFCMGLLYHLDRPTEFLHTLARSTNRVLLLETHYATEELPTDAELAEKLGPMVEHEGNRGRWRYEYAEGASTEEVEGLLWSSWGNPSSFWIEKRHLLQTLRDAGFGMVYEQYDYLDDIVNDQYIERNGRSLFVAVKDR